MLDQPEDSPFLSGTNIQFAWDSTSLGWAKTCPRLYYYNMLCGYRPKDESVHLRFGIEYHTALEEYDYFRAAGADHDEAEHLAVADLVERLKDYKDPDGEYAKPSEKVKTKENLLRTVIWYLEEFKNDAAQTYIKTDGKPAVEQSFRFELDFGPQATPETRHSTNKGIVADQPYILCGHLDRIVNYNDGLFIMDRKTTTQTPGPYYFKKYDPDNQMTLYAYAGQVVLRSQITGVLIDVAQVAVNGSKFVRGVSYRSPDQIEEWVRDLHVHLRTFERYAVEGYWPQNDTACDKFGGCRFRGICSKSPSSRQMFLDNDFTQEEPWNPLKVR